MQDLESVPLVESSDLKSEITYFKEAGRKNSQISQRKSYSKRNKKYYNSLD